MPGPQRPGHFALPTRAPTRSANRMRPYQERAARADTRSPTARSTLQRSGHATSRPCARPRRVCARALGELIVPAHVPFVSTRPPTPPSHPPSPPARSLIEPIPSHRASAVTRSVRSRVPARLGGLVEPAHVLSLRARSVRATSECPHRELRLNVDVLLVRPCGREPLIYVNTHSGGPNHPSRAAARRGCPPVRAGAGAATARSDGEGADAGSTSAPARCPVERRKGGYDDPLRCDRVKPALVRTRYASHLFLHAHATTSGPSSRVRDIHIRCKVLRRATSLRIVKVHVA
jgi:hypothetical protein